MIYLNAASHGLPDARTNARMLRYAQRETEIGPVAAEREAHEELMSVRSKAARLVGAGEPEVAFMPTTTIAWGTALASLPLKGERILVAPDEWGANLEALRRLRAAHSMRQEVMAVSKQGDLDLAALARTLDDDVAAICVPMVSSLTGRRYPVEEIGRLSRPETCFFIVDGAQALGQMEIDVGRIGCDIFAATARKWLRGPRGIAILYTSQAARGRMTPVPFPDYASMTWRPGTEDFADCETAARFETFDYARALRIGLGAALDIAGEMAVPAIAKTIDALARHARARIARVGLTLASPEQPQSGITSFLLPADSAERVRRHLDDKDIVVKCPDHANEPLREPPRDGQVLTRVSAHVYNQTDHIDALFNEIETCL